MENQKQHLESQEDTPVDLEAVGQDKVDHSRRKFTGAGLGVSAIFTLASQPVLATGKICKSPSGFHSLGFASHHGTPPTCYGKPPSYWCNTSQWPVNNYCFHDKFSRGSRCDYGHKENYRDPNGPTCKEVMLGRFWENGWAKPDPVGRECTATLLNIKAGHIPSSICTETKLLTLWNEFKDKGFCQPTAGVNWYAADIVKWCQSMQG
jgi:hypothetical protein